MKTRTLTLLIAFLLVFSNISIAQITDPLAQIKEKTQLKTDVVGCYPTEVWEYLWQVEYWRVHQKQYISYSSFGEPTQIVWIGDEGESRSQYTYNSNHQLTRGLEQRKVGDNWVDDIREVSEYDGDGHLTTQIVETWDGSVWMMSYGTQYSYVVEEGNVVSLVVKIWSREDNTWIYSSRSTFSFSQDNSVIDTIIEMWEDGAWVNAMKTRQEVDNERLIEMLMSAWEDNAWSTTAKMVYEYGDFESNTMTLYTGAVGAWIQSQRIIDNYDSHGNNILNTVEYFMGGWLMLSGSQFDLTYDGDNLVERITKAYGMGEPGTKGATFGDGWQDVRKEEFKDFASLSTLPIIIENVSIDHFPNPARERVSMKINNLQDRNLTIIVMDLAGKTVHQDRLYVPSNSFMHVVNLEDLPVGTFIIQARDASGKLVSSSRLIHQ